MGDTKYFNTGTLEIFKLENGLIKAKAVPSVKLSLEQADADFKKIMEMNGSNNAYAFFDLKGGTNT